jgi:hypothetical protein
MTIHARRHSPRFRLNETVPLNFGAGNCGVVLDVSHGGLRFKTTSPLQKSESIKFYLTSSKRSEIVADLAWADASRTTGGLHFRTVFPDIHDLIRAWLDQVADDSPPEAHKTSAHTRQAMNPESQTLSFPHKHEWPWSSTNELKNVSGASRPIPGSKGNRLSIFPLEQAPSLGYTVDSPQRAWKKHRLAVVIIVMLFLLGAATAAAAYYYPREVLDARARAQAIVMPFIVPSHKQPISRTESAALGEMVAREPGFTSGSLELAPQRSDINGVTSGSSVSLTTSASSLASGMVNLPAHDKESAHSAKSEARSDGAVAVKNKSDAELALALSYLRDGRDPKQKAKAVQLLWLATQKRNVDAELQLADLYTEGVAVQQNCEQARILLKAAATAKSALAQRKLAELEQAGCT